MSIIVIGSSEPHAGRSLIAAALAYRVGRAGGSVSLVRLAGDDGAAPDATAFAALEGIVSPGTPLSIADLKALKGAAIVEAPAGDVAPLASVLDCRVIEVAGASSRPLEVERTSLLGRVMTRVPASQGAVLRVRAGVLAVLREDRVLAAPSVADIAAATGAHWLIGASDGPSVERIMIGTVASDAAEPYFANRERTCVITRFDKTDIQLAALQTDVECLVITGAGEPSPYLIDRVQSSRQPMAVLAANGSTVETVRTIEPLFGLSRFQGPVKLARAVALLDEAGFELPS